ncbi:MAG: GNAT family N-acetyltransferase [Gemmatimonadota bacterium]
MVPMAADSLAAVIRLWRRSEGLTMRDVDTADGLGRFLERSPGLSFVARIGDDVCGAVLCGHDARRGYLHHLAVAPEQRRQGIGTALVERCLSALRDAGIGKCHLFVNIGNEAAMAFWKRSGWFERTDLHTMSRILVDSPDA